MFSLTSLFHALQVIGLDAILSGDNAVVIALACRGLPPNLRTRGVVIGAAGAIGLRIALVWGAMSLLAFPGVKLGAALLLLWIAVKMVAPGDEDEPKVTESDRLWRCVATVMLADLVMSIDNIAAIAAVADGAGEHRMLIVVLGLAVSIPFVVFGSQLLMKAMERFPVIVPAGAVLIGWVAGSLAVSDKFVPTLPVASEAVAAVFACCVFMYSLYSYFPSLTDRSKHG
jgi:YjbE family integral membrane protein